MLVVVPDRVRWIRNGGRLGVRTFLLAADRLFAVAHSWAERPEKDCRFLHARRAAARSRWA
jgi:hypothetical protein